MNTQLVPANIDGKNVADDWLYEEFAQGEYAAAQFGPDRRMAFYRGLALFEVTWKVNDNMIVFYSRNPFCGDEIAKLIKDLTDTLQESSDMDYRMTVHSNKDIYITLYVK